MERNRKSAPPKGFASLADFIASDPDHSSAIFRRFDRLSARDILYLQSEIAELEALQDRYDREDIAAGLDEKIGLRDWNAFCERVATQPWQGVAGVERDKRRMELAMKIREKLKEYSALLQIPCADVVYRSEPITESDIEELILLESSFLSMRRPSNQASSAFYNYFWNQDDPNGSYPTLLGASRFVYEDRDDLLALVRPPEEDLLTSIFRKHFSRLFLVGAARLSKGPTQCYRP